MVQLIDLDLLGYAAAALTTSAFAPQTFKTIRSRDTQGISLWMYVIFTTGIMLWLMYGIVERSWPLILANAITLPLAATILGLKLRYG
jgi:MtN3 and saliva related transmembrane protein